MNNKRIVLYVNFFTVCAFLILCLSLYNAPLCFLDDPDEIFHVQQLTFRELFGVDVFHFFRPVKNLLFYIFMLDKPWGLFYARIISFIISFCAYFSVKKLLIKVTGSGLSGSVAGAFWLLAPTMVGTIAWLSCTNIMVMVLTGASALLCYIKSKECSSKRDLYLFMTCILLFINMVSYEGGVALAAMIFALDFFMYPDDLKDKKVWINYIYFSVVTLLYLAVRFFVTRNQPGFENLNFGEELTDIQLIVSAAWFTVHHILLWILPSNSQYIVGCYSWGDVPVYLIYICWLIIIFMSIFILMERKKQPILSLSISWCLLGFLPMSNVLAFRNGPYGDYYLSYASVGLVLFIAYLVLKLEKLEHKKKYIGYGLVMCYMAYLFNTTLYWIPAWKNSIFMIENTLVIFPEQRNMLYSQINYYMGIGDKERAAEILLGINSSQDSERSADAYRLWLAGKYQEAFDLLEEEEKKSPPASRWSLYFRGYLQGECLSNDALAIEFYIKAIDYNDVCDFVCQKAIDQLATTYLRNNKTLEAIELWKKILPLSENSQEIQKKINFAQKHIIQ